MAHRFLLLVFGLSLGVTLSLAGVRGQSGSKSAGAASLPGLPGEWPTSMQLGMADAPGGAAAMKATAPFGFRYQYLAGGANTGSGWATWNPDGSFVTYYI